MIAIDFETYLISDETPSPPPVCLSYATRNDSGLYVGISDMESYLRQILSSNELIVAHNATFECLVIYNYFPELRNLLWSALDSDRIYCTQLGEKLKQNRIDKRSKTSGRKISGKLNLATLVEEYFHTDISESKSDPNAWRLRYSELDGTPLEYWPQEAISYAIEDSEWAYKLKEMQQGLCVAPAVRASFALNLMGHTGFLVDKNRVAILEQELLNIVNPLYEMLVERGFCELKKGKYTKKMKVLREYILETFPTQMYTAKGIIATSKEAMANYIGQKPDEIILAFQKLTEYEKMLSTYIPSLKKASPVIRTSYNGVVETNRTSSRGDKSFVSWNAQNLPRGIEGTSFDIRSCCVPRPGFKIVSIDYNGLEIAGCANQLFETFGYSAMRDMLNKGDIPFDMHSNYARHLMQVKTGKLPTYDEFVANKKKEGYKEYRDVGKPVNLSFPGGVGYDTMRVMMAQAGVYPKFKEIERSINPKIIDKKVCMLRKEGYDVRKKRVSPTEYALVYDEIIELKRLLFKLYPELEEYLTYEHKKKIIKTRNKYGKMVPEFAFKKNEFGEWEKEELYKYTIVTPDGENFTRGYCNYTAACNGHLMQSPAAIGAKRAMYRIIKKYFEHEDMNPLAFVHDEVVFEVRDNSNKYNIIEDVSRILVEEMMKVLPHVRIAVEAEEFDCWKKAGGDWSREYWINFGEKDLKSR